MKLTQFLHTSRLKEDLTRLDSIITNLVKFLEWDFFSKFLLNLRVLKDTKIIFVYELTVIELHSIFSFVKFLKFF